ncbi:MAG: Integral membrane protein [Parcubacteria group bacterium GW2011_GWC2_39_14]|nr:MAG: Integral membrane protein [Parcubacteria group bacterium GW2011_GWC2_39_14]KKR54967.1 MAG: Integral membrane protein [Parcubacteria group bacterium GW2011_GWA2_40_23]
MRNKIIQVTFCLVIPQIAGLIGALFTTSQITSWYATLIRPTFAPPNWIFAPVWTLLFLLMGISLLPIIKSKIKNKDVAYIVFGTQLVLNVFWSIFFFGLQSPAMALFEIIFLWVVILMNILIFFKIDKWSGILLIPYFLWVSFAGVLNYFFWILNK